LCKLKTTRRTDSSFPYLEKGLYEASTPTAKSNSLRSSLRNWKDSGTAKEQGYYGTLKGSTRKRASGSTDTSLRNTYMERKTKLSSRNLWPRSKSSPCRAFWKEGTTFKVLFLQEWVRNGNPGSFRALAPYGPAFRPNRLRSALRH